MDVSDQVRHMLEKAVRLGASDVHFIPGQVRGVLKFRIDGNLGEAEDVPLLTLSKMIAHFKFISGMDPGERRMPQSKSIERQVLTERISLRISTFPSCASETMVMRIFRLTRALQLNELALFPSQVRRLTSLLFKPQGLILFCGPTGTGKTTTLYSLLEHQLNQQSLNVMTLEDPVERKYSGILQTEINERSGMTYATGLKSILRHDPDVIMLGEIRDAETAKSAVRAAMTGHLVFSTVHCSSSAGALYRMQELGVPLHDLDQALSAVVSQSLVSITCKRCLEVPCSDRCESETKRKRAAVFEFLEGDELTAASALLRKGKQADHLPRRQLKDIMVKATAIGAIDPDPDQKVNKQRWWR
ncbi:competence type IV pilus ATPase ComGA [Salisediminibacterium selenitireducens]|uniref:Type II secretion system protein E n=1 Tax=Bacillus selenitireducens (strain ATCC 700615 / DSM 15326 / MLS10) TaxID=439292 RepID=D6XW43_BACIE|nr:competence type IV pilus ATPase ComGA [Salisediminibacterium selenitireducens]ADH99797.1 type II secretion system protein E [[Bacillus] selenitireducens MLS10]